MDDNQREAAWITLRQMLESKARGDRITASDVIDATGFEEWRSFSHRIRRWATKRGFVLFAVCNDGWRIGLPHEHVDKAEQRRRIALRQEIRGLGELTVTPTEQLDDRQLRRHQFAASRAQQRVEVARIHNVELRPKRLDADERPPARLATGNDRDD